MALRSLDLTRLFRPRVVAVIGASDTVGRPNTGIWNRVRDWAEANGADVRPVNPTRATIDGRPSVASILDIEVDVDLAVILVNDVQAAVEDAIKKGATFAVAFASGFAELGDEGKARQHELAELVAGSDLHLLGPNTNLNLFETFRTDLAGQKIALITQSGHQGRPVFQAQDLGIALSAWAPTGNEVDLEFADFVQWFADQPETGVIAAYIEGFKDGRTLQLAADHAARVGVPVVCVKVGRTAEGASMATSHTGKLTGRDAVVDAVFRQHGVTRVTGLDELIDTSQLMARCPNGPVGGDGVVVYSISGGTGAHMADICSMSGLRLPTLSTSLQDRLHEWIPSYLRVSNPVDCGGPPVGDERGRKILDALVADPDVGVLICPITGAFAPMSDLLAQDLVDLAETTDKPVCVIWGSPVGDEPAYRDILLRSSKVAVFRTFAGCARAVKAWLDWHAFRASYVSPFPKEPKRPSPAASVARPLLRAGALSEHESKAVLAAYGIPVTREEVVTSAAEAVRAASSVGDGAPVVLKASGGALAHKSDVGGVRLGVAGAAAVRRAYQELSAVSGGDVLVCEQVTDSVAEVVVGVSRDELFGPVIAVGLGGVLVEVLGDVTFRVPPFERAEAHRMLDELRGAPLLRGARGRPKADEKAIVEVVLKVQRLAVDLRDEIAEIDINPLVVRARGRGAVAVDALVVPG